MSVRAMASFSFALAPCSALPRKESEQEHVELSVYKLWQCKVRMELLSQIALTALEHKVPESLSRWRQNF